MKVGIVGFKGSGKTTVFNALTGLSAEVGGFTQSDSKNLGNIKVPDERLKRVADSVKPKKTIYAEILFADLAGTTTAEGKGFSSHALAEMRSADALVHVVRGFHNPALAGEVDLPGDLTNFESELVLADLIVVENRMQRLQKQGMKDREWSQLEMLKTHLEEGRPLRTLDLSDEIWAQLSGFGFLSQKACIVLLNVPEEAAAEKPPAEVEAVAKANSLKTMLISGQFEMEVNDLDEDEKKEYLLSLGLEESAKGRFIREVYDMLDLISFITTGPEEVRAWTIRKGTNALSAAGRVHSDMERGFIRAEVMEWRDMAELGSDAKCREAGKMRLEGKEYIPQDGEVVHFRFNV